MRITNAQTNAIMNSSLSHSASQLGTLMQQMASGKRLTVPSDDPIASVRILRLQREEASLKQYQTNIQNVSSRLSTQEVNLTSASDTLLSIRDLLVWAANANTAEDLAAMAGELSSLEETLVSYFNVRDEEGRYLLSGTKSDEKTLELDPGTGKYTLGGNDKTREAAVANGVFLEENVTLAGLLNNDPKLLDDLHAVVATLQDPANHAADPAAVQAQVRALMDQLDASHAGLLAAITDMGGRQNTLTLLKDSQADMSVANQKVEGELSTLDYASASLDLANYKLALQATQKTYLQINNLSLFNLL